jgi:hypothetical protein
MRQPRVVIRRCTEPGTLAARVQWLQRRAKADGVVPERRLLSVYGESCCLDMLHGKSRFPRFRYIAEDSSLGLSIWYHYTRGRLARGVL